MGGIRRNLRKGDKTSEWAVWYERFQDAGAQVSFMDLRGVEEWNRQLASLGKKGALDGSKATVKKIGEFINDYNTVVENAVRLSAFKTAIESGMSESDAASMAKNLTVNFNRKGELGPAMNALYMFANAGVQGSARILQALTNKKSRKRMGKLMGSVVAMSFALAELNRLSAGDDDDDENRWDKIGDYTKQVNLIFATDEGEWKIRTPYGYNSFVALGYALNDLYHYSIGDGGKSPSEVSWFMVSTLKNAFNPLGGDESLMKILSPTITDPIVELTTNENFMGENIRPENFQFGPQKPDSQLYFRTVSQASKSVTGWLNRVTGGSEWEPGMIDVSPETLDHLFGFAFGGVGRSVMRIADLPAKITNGELQVRNVPFARQVYQEKVPYVDFDRFYDNMNKISASRAAVKEMPVNQRRSYIADHPEIRMAKMAGRYNRQLSKMRERYYALKDSGQHEQAKNMQERMQAHVLRFNKVYNGIVD
jgi:anti-sigma28 factor (negative regulator of flagellin synthesis)